jgi:hypothetical protein
MVMGRRRMLLALVVLADLVVVSRLEVVMCSGMVAGGRLVMMLRGRMLSFFGHDAFPG